MACISETLPRGGEQVLTLARWSPTSELTNLHTAMDRLFSDLFGEALRSPITVQMMGRAGAPAYHLPVDVMEVDNGYRIQAPVPGFKPEDVEVTFSDGVLTINAKRAEEKSRQEGKYLRREVAFGNFQRQLTLPGDVRADQIKARFENGILTLEVPRAPKPKPMRIPVQPGERAKLLTGAGSKSR